MNAAIIRKDRSCHCNGEANRPEERELRSESAWERDIYLSSHAIEPRKSYLFAILLSLFLLFLGLTPLSLFKHNFLHPIGGSLSKLRGGEASYSAPSPYRETFSYTPITLVVSPVSLIAFSEPDIYCSSVGGAA